MTRRGGQRKKPNALSRSEKKASPRAHDEHQDDSVFDFLYHDARRLGSFLGQFENSGFLQGVTEGDEAAVGVKRGLAWKAGVTLPNFTGMPGESPEASLGLDIGPSQVGRQSSERVYDPYWTNARNFLDFAEGAGLLVRDAAQARLGQLVLITGRLTVLDTRIVKEAIALPQFANSAIASSVADGTDLETSQFGLEMLKVLPMEVQATITDGGGSTWMTLAPAYISGSTADLMLKHGHQVAGDWSVVGILDALPDAGGHLDTAVQQAMDTAMVSAAAFQTNAIGLIAMLIAPLARMAMGRPAAARGVTPLLIFREVTGG